METSGRQSMRRIVVGARPQGEEPWVLKAAAELAHQTGADLVVISVDELETEKLSTVPRSEVTARAEQAAAESVERLREAGIEATMEVRRPPVRADHRLRRRAGCRAAAICRSPTLVRGARIATEELW